MLAVFGSGISSMSEGWMPFHPAIDDPSKACPSSNLSAPNALTGTETCCSLPRVSVNRRSTNLTSFSLINFSTSAGVVMQDLLGLKARAERANSASQKQGASAKARNMPYDGPLQTPASVQFFHKKVAN